MGWSGSAMVLGKLPVPGRPAGLGSGGALFAVGADGGCLDFFFCSIISLLSSSLGDGSILIEILPQGLLDPKQPTKCCLFSYFSYNTKNTLCWSM